LELTRFELQAEEKAGEASWGEVCSNPFFRNVVIIGCLTQTFQIITGINAIVSFGGTLFDSLGLTGIIAKVAPFCLMLLGNMIGAFGLVDKTGRRPLLVYGMTSMAIALLAGGFLALSYGNDGEKIPSTVGYVIVSMVMTFLFSFGVSWGFGAWLYISEIMPLRVRGKAVGLATAVNWGPANLLTAFVTPIMLNSPLGPGGTLVFFGVVSLIAIPFAATCIPETKGKALEEITPLFRFSGRDEFKQFVRGNLKGGLGMTDAETAIHDTEAS